MTRYADQRDYARRPEGDLLVPLLYYRGGPLPGFVFALVADDVLTRGYCARSVTNVSDALGATRFRVGESLDWLVQTGWLTKHDAPAEAVVWELGQRGLDWVDEVDLVLERGGLATELVRW